MRNLTERIKSTERRKAAAAGNQYRNILSRRMGMSRRLSVTKELEHRLLTELPISVHFYFNLSRCDPLRIIVIQPNKRASHTKIMH